jgi:ubiquitin C-terminal hydrolase
MQGLQNLGATCAVNSLIQIICRTDYLRDIILNSEVSPDTLTAELKEILHMMHHGNHHVSPGKFLTHLYRHFDGIFRRGEQMDIGELWMFLFDRLASELAHHSTEVDDNIRTVDLDTYNNAMMASDPDLQKHCLVTMNRFNNNKTSAWLDTSQGIMLNIIKCNKCTNIVYNFEPFISIAVDIPEDDDLHTIAEMFRNYLKAQICDEHWKCDKCNQSTSYTKQLKIWKMPNVLIFIIKRFANMHMKNTKPIIINKSICVKKGSILNDMSKDYNYKCTAMGYHLGGLYGGHYFSICNLPDDKYVLYDDLNVNIISDEKINGIFDCNKDAYMLVYTLVP